MLIRDTVHGDIELGPLEVAVLDSPAVQRLRGIKQLGTAYLVYPGAVHSRFEHSLGTCATAHSVVGAIRRSGAVVDADTEAMIGVAALLHDVTHVPFGHTLEDERRLFPRHDKGDRLYRLLDGELGKLLGGLGIGAGVSQLLLGEGNEDARWQTDVVSSTIDADLLDYLRRDSLYAGLAQNYDERVFRYFAISGGRLVLDMSKHGMPRPDAWSEIVQLLRMRYFLTERVYYHHTKVVAGAMISKAVEMALAAGELAESALLDLDDAGLLTRLGNSRLPEITSLIDRIRRRRLLKRGWVLSRRSLAASDQQRFIELYHESPTKRAAAERQLAAALGAPPHEVIVYCPAATMMKEAAALALTPGGVVPMTEIDPGGASEISALAQRHADLWRMYVFVSEPYAERAAKLAADQFGATSEHCFTAGAGGEADRAPLR